MSKVPKWLDDLGYSEMSSAYTRYSGYEVVRLVTLEPLTNEVFDLMEDAKAKVLAIARSTETDNG